MAGLKIVFGRQTDISEDLPTTNISRALLFRGGRSCGYAGTWGLSFFTKVGTMERGPGLVLVPKKIVLGFGVGCFVCSDFANL